MSLNGQVLGEMDRLYLISGSATMLALAFWMAQLIAGLVQIFYAWRIWDLARSKFMRAVALIIVFLALIRGLGAMNNALEVVGFKRYYSAPFSIGRVLPEFLIWSAGGLPQDALITICMAYILLQSDAIRGSESKLATMAQLGAFPPICACIDVVLVVYWPSTNYHFVPAYILGKMYTTSLVFILNLRHKRSCSVLLI